MKYEQKSFNHHVGSQAYRDNWEKIFKPDCTIVPKEETPTPFESSFEDRDFLAQANNLLIDGKQKDASNLIYDTIDHLMQDGHSDGVVEIMKNYDPIKYSNFITEVFYFACIGYKDLSTNKECMVILDKLHCVFEND